MLSILNDVSALKHFPTEIFNGSVPVREVPFFDVSEPEEANSALQRSFRLTICKISILNVVSALKIFLPKN